VASTASKTRSQKVREDLSLVQIVARTGRLPIISDSEEYIGPGIPPRKIPGVVLEFGDNGLCELHPIRNAREIEVFDEWFAEGTDPRIAELGVMVVEKDALVPPFPKWDTVKPEACLEAVENLGLDALHCLRYELQKGKDARSTLVKKLEIMVDAPPAEDPVAEPTL
jgi:hypothetical protein